ncbi:MAG: type II toxin-antitoxin system VapC family toxin [Betaproteobacteria bacterium]|nr:type II toxin-antitoxin system VapC family toxin [Betaproteobacteria bacterium]
MFVLDASVTLRWALLDGSVADRVYADRVLDTLANAVAWVPALWYTETIHALRCAESDGKLGESAVTEFVYRLGQLPIEMDQAAPGGIQLAVTAVSREFKLFGYDAQYLELARRRNLSIATLDKDFRKAAKKAGVAVYLLEG